MPSPGAVADNQVSHNKMADYFFTNAPGPGFSTTVLNPGPGFRGSAGAPHLNQRRSETVGAS